MNVVRTCYHCRGEVDDIDFSLPQKCPRGIQTDESKEDHRHEVCRGCGNVACVFRQKKTNELESGKQ